MAAADVSERGSRGHPRSHVLAVQVATFALIWAGWEALSRSGLLYEGVVPSSLAVFPSIASQLIDPVFWDHFGRTAYEVVAGFAIGSGRRRGRWGCCWACGGSWLRLSSRTSTTSRRHRRSSSCRS